MITIWISAVLGAGGALMLYMASPAQQLRKKRPAFRLCMISGSTLLCASLLMLLASEGSGTAVSEFLTLIMIVWSLVPLAAAVWRRRMS